MKHLHHSRRRDTKPTDLTIYDTIPGHHILFRMSGQAVQIGIGSSNMFLSEQKTMQVLAWLERARDYMIHERQKEKAQ